MSTKSSIVYLPDIDAHIYVDCLDTNGEICIDLKPLRVSTDSDSDGTTLSISMSRKDWDRIVQAYTAARSAEAAKYKAWVEKVNSCNHDWSQDWTNELRCKHCYIGVDDLPLGEDKQDG